MNANELMRLTDFWPTRILLTAADLDIFAKLVHPANAAEVAKACSADPRALEMLLDALVALEVLTKDADRYAVTPDLRGMLLPGPECVVPSILHRSNLWNAWSGLTDVVRSGEPAVAPYEDDQRPDDQVREFIAAMAVSARYDAPSAIATLDLHGVRTVLDIGGGPGVYVAEFCKAVADLQAVILDLPRVCEIAGANLADTPCGQRVGFVPGEVGSVSDTAVLAACGADGYDLVFASNLIHSMDAGQVQGLFRRMLHWTKPGGRVVVKDFFLTDGRTEPPRAAIFAINMLVNTPGGRSYTWSEVEQWLREAAREAGLQIGIEPLRVPDSDSGMVVLVRNDG